MFQIDDFRVSSSFQLCEIIGSISRLLLSQIEQKEGLQMNIGRKIALSLATAGVAAGLALGGAAAANAAVVYPAEGGTWDYGVDYWVMKTWSNYHHPSRVHHSTACSASACSYSGWVPAGYWSKVSRQATWGGNTAYYKVS